MKRASFRHACEFIALNDESADMDPESIAGYVSVVLVSEIFEVSTDHVARVVLKIREQRERDDQRNAARAYYE